MSPHWPSVRGRARAGAGPLALVAAVVLVVTLLAAAVPPLLRTTADAAARDAIRRAGPDAAVRVDARWEDDYGDGGGRVRNARLASDVDDFGNRAVQTLEPRLRALLRPPVTTVTSISLLVTDGSTQRRFQLDYVRDQHGGPAVTWLTGHAPRGTAAGDVETPFGGPPWQTQVGLSEASAAALKLGPGDRVPVEDEQRNTYDVLVSGVFRPVDAADPAWRSVPWVLRPAAGLDGAGSTRLGGLLSAESLPDAHLAFQPDQLDRTVWFTADPDALTWDSAQRLAATVVALKASSGSATQRDTSLRWDTQLDAVVRDVRAAVDAARAQASVLLIAVLAGAALVLLLAADLLARRRAPALVAARQRGASLAQIGAELLVESVAVTLPAAALALVLSSLLASGVGVRWAAVVVVCALLAAPAFGTRTAARGTLDRHPPANRSARRRQLRTARLRRATVDVAFVVAAAAALVSLRQRGLADTTLPASAPTLGAVAGALLVLRVVPLATAFVLRQALRSRRPVFGAARAAATAGRALPLLGLTVTLALATFAVTLDTTTARDTAAGAWRTVGADARLDVPFDDLASTPRFAARIGAAPGVDQVVVAQVSDQARVIADGNALTPGLVVVDAAAYQRLLADTPLPDAPDLSRLREPAAGAIPVLVHSGDGSLRPGMTIRLLREGADPVELRAVGTAPVVDDTTDVILVDAAAGLPFTPNTVWVTGPGAASAVAPLGPAVVRTDVVHQRANAPLPAGLTALERASAAVLLILGLLGFALGATATAPERWTTLARLRTLGLRPRETYRVAVAELLPPVLVGAVAGPLLGWALARWYQHGTVVPWWLVGLAAVLMFAVLLGTVGLEARVRRRRRLGDVLRVGGG